MDTYNKYYESLSDVSKRLFPTYKWEDIPRDMKIDIYDWIYNKFSPGGRKFNNRCSLSTIVRLINKQIGIPLTQKQMVSAMSDCGFRCNGEFFTLSNNSKYFKENN